MPISAPFAACLAWFRAHESWALGLVAAAGFVIALAAMNQRPGQAQALIDHAIGLPHPQAQRDGTVAWPLFTAVTLRLHDGVFQPVFGAGPSALEGRVINVQGYFEPLEAGSRHSHFLLAKDSPTCPYCLADGPDQMMEVYAAEPIAPSQDAMVLSGRLTLLREAGSGLYYRLDQARRVD
ncbi:hypothetical protein [Chitinimonas koreensis]|uniref:hypothetical protein n=1 Tax=Chitinimonas koreensis TaxID=356302 RepID=UPI000412FFF5|nr:hypothetical protein [Chitinimonas koreensis]QNM97856.1 hypothetical protein H9L41_06195 [Chitinimonas koreensis]